MSRTAESLSESDRIMRIGEILFEAIAGAGFVEETDNSQGERERDLPTIPSMNWPLVHRGNNEGKVINHLRRVGEASPAQLRTMLGMPKTSAYRVMNRLTESGLIVSGGHTRAVVYRLNSLPPHNQNVEGN